ncbi:MAG: ABC transporter permease [Desulfobacterota bacterium]|nr:ABC transporter permease [Thermodesulfobacteriota bacterium]
MRLRDIAINNLRRRKARVFFLILGLSIGVTTVVTLISVTRLMEGDIARKLDEFGANILILPRSEDLSLSYGGMVIGGLAVDVHPLKNSDVPQIWGIKERESLLAVSPKLAGHVEMEGRRFPLMGVDFLEERRIKRWWKVRGELPKQDGEVLLGSEVAVRLFKSPGDELALHQRKLRVSGILEETGSKDDFFIYGPLRLVQEVLNQPEGLSLIEVSALCNTCPIEEIVNQISKQLPHAKVMAIKQTLQTKMETLDHFKKFSVGLSFLVLLIGALIVFTNMMASVNERRREIGIFRAIGFRKSHIIRMIFFEALLVGMISGAIGYLIGSGISRAVGPSVLGLKEIGGAFNPVLLTGAISFSGLIGVLSSLYPALKASKMDPTEALRAL